MMAATRSVPSHTTRLYKLEDGSKNDWHALCLLCTWRYDDGTWMQARLAAEHHRSNPDPVRAQIVEGYEQQSAKNSLPAHTHLARRDGKAGFLMHCHLCGLESWCQTRSDGNRTALDHNDTCHKQGG